MFKTLLNTFLVIGTVLAANQTKGKRLSNSKIQEIRSYRDVADAIRWELLKGSLKGQAYKRLAYFVDKFGPRPSGSEELEQSIDYLLNLTKRDRFENVHSEEAQVPHWVRGEESAILTSPRFKNMDISALGGSISTPSEGISAHVLVVRSFEELYNKSTKAAGRIVVFNQNFTNYAESVRYRLEGHTAASRSGALAVLVRSPTPFSLYTVHTGWQMKPPSSVDEIPAACITVEDAEMMDRMQVRGDRLFINLKIRTTRLPSAKSRNVIAEIKGHMYPDEIVLIAAHVDSWDLSEGAMDDGAGVYVTLEAMLSLIKLNLRPKRTVRAVLFTAEETGLAGAKQYYKDHKSEVQKMNVAMELDEGIYLPKGFKFQGTTEAAMIMKEITKLLQSINCTLVREEGVDYGDTKYFIKAGVPGGALVTKDETYFYNHHTKADTMSIINSDHLDLAAVAWATVTYVLADMDAMLPR